MATSVTHVPENSSHIESFSYDSSKRLLHVRFRNKKDPKAKVRTYTYAAVPPMVFEAMKTHPSAGQYYHAVIKRHYKLV